MYKLKSPNEFTGLGAQCDYGVCPLVVTYAQSAIVIGAWAAGRNEDEVALGVDGHDGPGIGGTAAKWLRLAIADAIGPQWIPTPSQRARAGVIGTHYAARHIRTVIIIDR